MCFLHPRVETLPHPSLRLVDDVRPLQGDGAQVEVAPGPEGRHHVGDDDIKRLVIVGIHGEACSAAAEPQVLSSQTFTVREAITFISQPGEETE